MLEDLTHESFEPHVGSGFAISVDGHEDVLTLTEVAARKPVPGFDRAPFSLTFTGARSDALFNSQLLDMQHAELGTLSIMISPLGRNEDGTFRYEAVFG